MEAWTTALPDSPTLFLERLFETQKWFWSNPGRHRQGRENLKYAAAQILRKTWEKFERPKEDQIIRFAQEFAENHAAQVRLFPHTKELLGALKERGFLLGLISNGSSQVQRGKLRRFSLEPYFHALVIDQEAGFSKPDRRIFEKALDLLHSGPQSSWMVGDNLLWDVAASQQLGLFGVWHDVRGAGLPPSSQVVPDLIVSDYNSLRNVLL